MKKLKLAVPVWIVFMDYDGHLDAIEEFKEGLDPDLVQWANDRRRGVVSAKRKKDAIDYVDELERRV
jgi:hypothetical protein